MRLSFAVGGFALANSLAGAFPVSKENDQEHLVGFIKGNITMEQGLPPTKGPVHSASRPLPGSDPRLHIQLSDELIEEQELNPPVIKRDIAKKIVIDTGLTGIGMAAGYPLAKRDATSSEASNKGKKSWLSLPKSWKKKMHSYWETFLDDF